MMDMSYVILDSKKLTPLDDKNEILNDQGVNVLFSALDVNEFNRVKSLTLQMTYGRSSWKFMRAHQV